jgi:gas vesicle protein
MANIKQVNSIFLSFLLGGAVGGAIALLYAPKSGEQLRKDIKKTTNDLYEDGRKKTYESWNDAKEKAENIIDSANDVLSSNMEKIVRKSENLREALKSGVNAYNDEIRYGNNHNRSTSKEDMGMTNKQAT